MPRKKTFAAIRVRGTAQFDNVITQDGTPVTPLKEYIALMSQADTDNPSVTQIHNTLGVDITWTRVSQGLYRGEASQEFYPQNTVITITAFPQDPSPVFGCRAYALSGDIMVRTFDVSDGSNEDSVLSETPIRIEVYDIPFTPPPPP